MPISLAQSIYYQGVDYMPAAEQEFQYCLNLSDNQAINRCSTALFAKPFYAGYEKVLADQGRWPLSAASYGPTPKTDISLPVVPTGTPSTTSTTSTSSPGVPFFNQYLPYILIAIVLIAFIGRH